MHKKFLLRHVGNMGDLVFFIPPILETLKKVYPGCHITFVTAWGFKDRRGQWGMRNQGGFEITLIITNPHIDQLVHWHDTALSLDGGICEEEGKRFPTWNSAYYEQQKKSGGYDGVYELDVGIGHDENPIKRMYEILGMPNELYSEYRLYLTQNDQEIAQEVMRDAPRPRIVLLESLTSPSTRGWDPAKVSALEHVIGEKYGVAPLWFGERHIPDYQGRPLTLRENIATLIHCDVVVGTLSGPLHFAAAVGTPTITLYCDQAIHRAAPAYFLNNYITDKKRWHRTLLGPSPTVEEFLKPEHPTANLTPAEAKRQGFKDWQRPGRQSTKSCLAAITVDEIMTVLKEVLQP